MKNVLVFEENGESRAILGDMLKKRGFNIISTVNSRSALSVLASARPVDLVIAGATGRADFMAELRILSPRLPVIFLTDKCRIKAPVQGCTSNAFSLSHTHNFYHKDEFQKLDRLIRIALNRVSGAGATGLAAS